MKQTTLQKGLLLLSGLVAIISIGCRARDASDHVNILNWGEYIGKTTNDSFTKDLGIKVNYSLFATNEELYSKLQAAPGEYDVIFPSDYMVKKMIAKGMLHPLDKGGIPNIFNLLPKFQPGMLPFDPEGTYAVPYHYGTCGIGYNAKAFPNGSPKSFKDLVAMSKPGRVTVLDDMRYTMGAALRTLGFSANTTDPHQLDAALALLKQLKPKLNGFNSTSYHTMLADGEVDIVFGYNVGVNQAALSAKNGEIRFVIPQEGAMLWVDSMVIPKSAPNAVGAMKYINHILSPKVGAEITSTVRTATPNGGAIPLLDKAMVGNPSIFPPQEQLIKAEFVSDLGPATSEFERRWAELKR